MNKDSIEGLRFFEGTSFNDSRGNFLRLFDSEWLSDLGFNTKQINISVNPKVGTLRGMHYQIDGDPENKLMTLLQGNIFLAIVDLRKSSPTYLSLKSQNLSAEEGKSILIPAGCATGWLSTSPDVQIHYVMSSRFENNSYGGFKYDEPTFKIPWPHLPHIISDQDNNWQPFQEGE